MGSTADVDLLIASLADEEPLVRSHVARALGSIGTIEAFAALRARLIFEEDDSVRSKLLSAIERSAR